MKLLNQKTWILDNIKACELAIQYHKETILGQLPYSKVIQRKGGCPFCNTANKYHILCGSHNKCTFCCYQILFNIPCKIFQHKSESKARIVELYFWIYTLKKLLSR